MVVAYNPLKADIQASPIPQASDNPGNTPAYNSQSETPLNVNLSVNTDETPLHVQTPDELTPAVPSDEVIQQRAFKAQYGLGDILKKSQADIYQNIYNGQEPDLRAGAAAEIDYRRQKAVNDAVTQYAANKGGPLSIDEARNLSRMVLSLQQNTDPDSIIEQAFAKQTVGELDRQAITNPNSVMADANRENPEAVAKISAHGEELLATREYMKKLKEDLQADIQDQSLGGWVVDQAKFFIPGYEDIKLRGNVPGVGMAAGITKTGNLDEQSDKLLQMPYEKRITTIKDTVEKMRQSNPTAAMEWLDAMMGMSTFERAFYNLGTAIDISSLPIGKAVLAGAKVATGIAEKSAVKEVEKATIDVIKGTDVPEVSRSTILDSAGDLKGAAVARSTASQIAEKQGIPQATRDSVEALKSTFRTDIADIKQNPGGRSQELINRITENLDNTQNKFLDTILNTHQVERLPDVLTDTTVTKAIIDATKDDYPWMRNLVLDTSPIYKEPLANRRMIDFIIGKPGGEYFSQKSVAENFVRDHGLLDAEVLPGIDTRFAKDYKRQDWLTKNISSLDDTIAKREAELKDAKTTAEKKQWAQEQIEGMNDFKNKYQTELSALQEKIGLQDKVSIEQQGLGYYIKITHPLRETDDAVRDAIAITKNTQLPDSLLNTFVGKIRTPEEVLANADRQNRLAVTYVHPKFQKLLADAAKDIREIKVSKYSLRTNKKRKWEDFQRVLTNAEELYDSKGVKGVFFNNPEELDSYYRQWIKRAPDDQEVAAYFSFKNVMEIDRQFRNIAEVRNQSRVGAKTQQFSVLNKDGTILKSPEFSGMERSKLPRNDDNILIMGDKVGDERVFQINKQSTKTLDELAKQIETGQKRLVELFYPERHPLENLTDKIGDKRIRYVVTDKLETKALDWNQIPRRGGGHLEYDYEHYLKQADVRHDGVADAWWYNGDKTFAPVRNRAMGQDLANKINKVRELLRDKKIDEARAFSNQNLGIDWDQMQSFFQPQFDAQGKVVPPRFSLNEPIQVVPSNKRIGDIDNKLSSRYGSKFRDSSKEGSIGSQYQVQFSGERDSDKVFTFRNDGTANRPAYAVEPAAIVDPITTMQRAIKRIASTNLMDDYKIFSIEHWLRQAEPYLDATKSELRYAPYHYFTEPRFRKGADAGIVRQLEAARLHIQTFAGMSSTTNTMLDNITQKMVDSIYGKFGPKASEVAQTWAIPALRDPFQFMRAVVFHSKLGLFNIPQFIVQAANYANLLGISGLRHGTAGTYAAQLHFWGQLSNNEAILARLDKYASSLNIPGVYNWKPGEFLRAREELMKTAFGHAAGKEYAALDALASEKVIPSAAGTFLDWGSSFFRYGEQNARLGAWYTAFAEHLSANPLAKITDADRAKILQRADLLNINMSRASSSMVHQGIWSVPTQFLTYQLRLMELFIGKRLTMSEKARLFMTNGALYGFPMAAGLTGWPVSDIVRQKAMENGYVVGDNYFSSIMMEGIPSAMGALITGGGDIEKGTWYDFGPRLGTKGFDFVNSFNPRNDKTLLDIFGGASYSVLKGTWEQSDGFRAAMGSLFRRDEEQFPMKIEDFVDLFKEISSVNTAWRTLMAINTGRWLSKKDNYLADTSKADSIFSAITGLKDVSITDMQILTNSLQETKSLEKEVKKRFLQEYRRGVMAQKSDPEQAKQFFTRAQTLLTIGGYPEDKISSLLSEAASNNQATIDRLNWDFYLKYSPDSQKDVRYKAYQKILQKQSIQGK